MTHRPILDRAVSFALRRRNPVFRLEDLIREVYDRDFERIANPKIRRALRDTAVRAIGRARRELTRREGDRGWFVYCPYKRHWYTRRRA